ncbi:RlpA-like double-psi beta-barrel-protein domain-containing protein-containing protein, partial [Gongronella butleri]
SFEGHGTFFNPETEGGDRGACGGKKEDGSSNIVALSADKFGPTDKNSNWCGKTVLIRYGNKSTTAVIQDACPTCKSNSLDMTPSVFNKLADSSKGIIPITW